MTTAPPTNGKGLVFTAHPIVDVLVPPIPPAEQVVWAAKPGGRDQLLEYWEGHEAMIAEALEDPLNKGFELPFWADVRAMMAAKDETYALGGNGPGKTEIGAKLVVETLCAESGRKVLCISQNEATSKQLQQAAVYRYSPAHARSFNERAGAKRRGVVAKFNYTQAGGFTESTFVYPNGSQCWFKTVEQFERDKTSFEGPEYDLIWPDEPIPLALRETLSYRAGKRAGGFLFTFTAVNGYDQICAAILEGAKVVQSFPINWQWTLTPATVRKGASAPGLRSYLERGGPDVRMVIPELKLTEELVKGLPKGHMPYIMQPLNPRQGIIFLWTHWNVFSPKAKHNPDTLALFEKCVRKPKHTVKTRLFGWTEKLAGTQFPNFNSQVHVISQERIDELLKPGARILKGTLDANGKGYLQRRTLPHPGPLPLGEGARRRTPPAGVTSYSSLDPATARSYFILWMLVDSTGRKYVFDESPRVEEGEWVGEDGNAGDGQFLFAGRGINFYKQHIRARELEHTIEPLRRFGDPRAFASEAAQNDGAKSLYDLFAEGPPEGNDDPDLGPLYFEPAQVLRSLRAETDTGSLDKINNALAYDPDQPLVVIENEPKLYISERCQNLIRCLLNWNPAQGEKSPWKDPVDCLRYLFGEELYYSDPGLVGRRGRGWGA